jgi:hypothetical protein
MNGNVKSLSKGRSQVFRRRKPSFGSTKWQTKSEPKNDKKASSKS